MLFDVQAALDKVLSAPVATPATSATQPAISAPVSRLSRVPRSQPAQIAQDADMFRHGASVTGLPRTWTGRVVSLDEWRDLTAWDKHGPDRRMYCGVCQVWVRPGDCPHCEGGAA